MRFLFRLSLLCALALLGAARPLPAAPSAAPLGSDVSTRAAALALFNTEYRGPSAAAPIEWTGQPAPTCVIGTTSAAFRAATIQRINYFRAAAGISPVSLSEEYSLKAQAAALMVQANLGTLSHSMPPGWPCHTSAGQEAGQKSNLAQGSNGPDAIDGYMFDYGEGNKDAGHRRWLLFPQTQRMGTGDTATIFRGIPYSESNVLWVMDDQINAPDPAVRDGFVAWPPQGFAPYQVVFPRWSFSVANANFAAATVSVTSGGQPVQVAVESRDAGYGNPTLVWRMAGLGASTSWPKPSADTPYQVTITGVQVGGESRSYSYSVTVFDPDKSVFTPTSWAYLPLVRR
jgi:uncharacterized protein YkwD